MFWNRVAGVYSLYEKYINGKVNRKLAEEAAAMVEKEDTVLECACGTGMISKALAENCSSLIATDYAEGMLKQARKNLSVYPHVQVQKADITKLEFPDDSFDKVVAGNVIHLLDKPEDALKELMRVCKRGGFVIVPTYVNRENKGKPNLIIRLFAKGGAGFKKQYDAASYRRLFEQAGYEISSFSLIEGRIPCAIVVIQKKQI